MVTRVALLVVLLAVGVHAEAWGKKSLKGIKTFGVNVVIGPGCDVSDNSVQAAIRTDVELQLRAIGITIKEKSFLLSDGADLLVDLACENLKSKDGGSLGWVVIDAVTVNQVVRLSRPDFERLFAATWEDGPAMFVGGKDYALQTARTDIRDKVSELLNEYLEINPR